MLAELPITTISTRYDVQVETIVGNIVRRTFDDPDELEIWLSRRRHQIVGDPLVIDRDVTIVSAPRRYQRVLDPSVPLDAMTIDFRTMLGAAA